MIEGTTGERLYAIEVGKGERAVVLVHGSGSRGLCNWWRELSWLPRAGFRVLAYDQSCVGHSSCAGEPRPVEDLRSVVSHLRRNGAKAVIVVGASAGGPTAIIAAAPPGTGISAVVSLSAAGLNDPTGTGTSLTARATVPSVRVPVLYVLARDDGASSVAELTAIHAASGSKKSQLVLLPAGAGHAQQVLYAGSMTAKPSSFRATFIQFMLGAG